MNLALLKNLDGSNEDYPDFLFGILDAILSIMRPSLEFLFFIIS